MITPLLISLYILGACNMWMLVSVNKNYERLILSALWPLVTALTVVVSLLSFLFDD